VKLIIFNGSPRGKGSNTRVLLEQFTRGFSENSANSFEIFYLNRIQDHPKLVEQFSTAELVFLAFPLYTDSVPGLVKAFIEALAPLAGRQNNPALAFLVQSGFPEAHHSRFVEKYLKKLAARLGSRYCGTLVKGGIEGIQIKSEWMKRQSLKLFYEAGREFGQSGGFSPELLKKIAKPEKLNRTGLFIFKFLQKLGMMNFYWDSQLKKNQAVEKRFAQPYLTEK
jgi:NAD(P)H-dependent FMN reductase